MAEALHEEFASQLFNLSDMRHKKQLVALDQKALVLVIPPIRSIPFIPRIPEAWVTKILSFFKQDMP